MQGLKESHDCSRELYAPQYYLTALGKLGLEWAPITIILRATLECNLQLAGAALMLLGQNTAAQASFTRAADLGWKKD